MTYTNQRKAKIAVKSATLWHDVLSIAREACAALAATFSRSHGQVGTDPLRLYAELAQVVVKMLVSSAAPFLRSQRAKERMRMPSTRRFPAFTEPPNLYPELFLLPKKVTRT